MTRKLYKQLCLMITFCLLLANVSPAIMTVYAEELLNPTAEVTYYISSSEGDDTNDGLTEATAWRTLDKVNSMTFQPGTNILFKKGDQWNGDLYINNSGEAGKMITYSTYGSGEERPVINGTGVPNTDQDGNLLWTSGSAAILVRDAEYIRIEGLGVTNMGVDKEGNPNLVENLADGRNERLRSGIAVVQVRGQENKVLNKIEIVNNEVYHVKGVSLRELYESQDRLPDGKPAEVGNMYNNAGIFFFIEEGNNSGITRIDDLLIENNYIHDTSCMGIHTQPEKGGNGYNSNPSAYNTNVRILNNQIARTGADGIIVGYTDKVLVEGNVAYDAGKKSTGNRVRVIAGIWPYNSSDSVFQYNEVARTHFDRGDGMAWDSDWGTSGDLIYQYNYSHENEGGTLMDCNTTDVHNWIHRYNLSVNEPGVQWTITAHEIGKIEFYNNTVYIAPGGGRLKIYAPHVSDVRMYNNIFVADTADYNDFRAAGNTFVNNIVAGHEGPYFGKNTIIDDPQFMDVTAAEVEKTLNNIVYLKTPGALDGWDKIQGWQLQSTSPAINRGLVVNSPKVPEALRATEDLAGNPVVGEGFDGKLDIGAFEFQGEYTGDGKVNIAPMAASHGVEVEFATTISEGIESRNIDGVNYELTNIKNGDILSFDKVNLDRNASTMTLKANVLEETTIEVTIGDTVVGEFTIEAGNGEYRVRFNEEVPSGQYPVQLTFKGQSTNELIRLDQFKLLPGRQGVVPVPYKYTFEDGVEGWYAVGSSGQVSTQNGQLKLTSGDIYTSTIAPEVENGIVEAEITVGPNQRSTLMFRYDELTGKYMEIGFDVGNYWFISSNGLGISQEQINSANCPTVESGKTYTLKIKYQGNHIQAFVDGVEILNKTFSSNTPSIGIVGMRKWQSGSSYTTLLDNIRINAGKISGQVTLADTNEPVVGAKVTLEGTTHETRTDANGQYVFDTVVLDQTYTVVVGDQSQVTQELTIANDEAVVDVVVAEAIIEANKEALINAVAAARQLDQSVYSEESWQALQIVITQAQELIAAEKATQEAVDAMVIAVEAAVVQLEIQVKTVPYKYTFETGTEGWYGTGTNLLSTENGRLKLINQGRYTSSTAPKLANGIVEAELTAGSKKRATILFKYDVATSNYLEFGFDDAGYWLIDGPGINQIAIDSAKCPPTETGRTYNLKVKYEGNAIQAFIDGEMVFDGTLEGNIPTSGTVGIRKWQTDDTPATYVDNIKINAGSIKGQVTVENEPVAHAEVKLAGTEHITYTDADGEYLFDMVELDKVYTVLVENESVVTPMVTIANDELTVNIEVAVVPSDVQKIVVSGLETIEENKSFTLEVGVEGIKDAVYAQDMTVQYDPAKVTFESVKKLGNTELAGFKDDQALGQVKVLMATPDGVEGTENLFEIVFSVNSVTKDESTTFGVTGQLGVVEENTGSIVELESAVHTLQIKDVPVDEVNKAELIAAIERAEAIYAQAEEGSRPGQYPTGAKAKLKVAIDAAKQVANSANSQEVINQAVEALNQAIKAFLDSVQTGMIEDVNKDNQVDIADLALIAYYYTAKEGDANWASAQVADINDDKEVNIQDLTLVAQKILDKK